MTLNSAAALVAKGCSVLVTLLLFPILLSYLGKEDFAVWLVVVSIVQILSWTDLGVGNSTVTLISRQSTVTDQTRVRAVISSAYACLAAITVVIAAGMAIAWNMGLPNRLLAREAGAGADQGSMVGLGLLAFLMWVPASLTSRIQTGLRFGRIPSLVQAASSIAMGLLSYWAVTQQMSLGVLVAIACFTPVAFQVANSVVFVAALKEYRPSFALVDRREIRELLRLGTLFFSLQIGIVALTGADSVIALRQAGPVELVDYSAVAKLFGAVSGLGALIFAPLWPEYGAAHAKGEYDWIRRTLIRSLAVAVAFGIVAGAVGFALSDWIFHIWIGPDVRPAKFLVALAATWLVIELCGQCVAMMLNGMAVLWPQVVLSLLFAAACLPMKWVLADSIGAAGIYVATIACYMSLVLLPYIAIVPRLLEERR